MPPARTTAIGIGAALYGSLAAACLGLVIRPPPEPQALFAALLGPPVLLVWGLGAWPWFLGFTAALGGCLILAVRGLRPLAIPLGATVWALGGFLSYAFSI